VNLLEQREARHVRQAEVDDGTVEGVLSEGLEGGDACVDDGDLDVVMGQQLDDAQPGSLVVFHDQEPLASGDGVLLDPGQAGLQGIGRRGLGHEREGAARETVLLVLFESNDLHRDVPRGRIVLQLA